MRLHASPDTAVEYPTIQVATVLSNVTEQSHEPPTLAQLLEVAVFQETPEMGTSVPLPTQQQTVVSVVARQHFGAETGFLYSPVVAKTFLILGTLTVYADPPPGTYNQSISVGLFPRTSLWYLSLFVPDSCSPPELHCPAGQQLYYRVDGLQADNSSSSTQWPLDDTATPLHLAVQQGVQWRVVNVTTMCSAPLFRTSYAHFVYLLRPQLPPVDLSTVGQEHLGTISFTLASPSDGAQLWWRVETAVGFSRYSCTFTHTGASRPGNHSLFSPM